MSDVAFMMLVWGSVLAGDLMPKGLISPLHSCLECLRSESMDEEVVHTQERRSMKSVCASSAKGRAVSVLIGAHFMVVSEWG